MNTDNTSDPTTLSNQIAGLMPDSDDRRMWRDMLASRLEAISEADNQTLIHAAQDVEAHFQAAAGGHLVQVTTNPNHGFLERCLRLAELDQDTRNGFLRACADELRKP